MRIDQSYKDNVSDSDDDAMNSGNKRETLSTWRRGHGNASLARRRRRIGRHCRCFDLPILVCEERGDKKFELYEVRK